MSADRDTTRIVRSWLAEGVTALPDRVLDAVLDQVPATPQRRRLGSARRSFAMHPMLKYALTGAAAFAVALAGYRVLGPAGIGNTPPSPAPSVTPAATTRVHDGQGLLDAGTWAMDIGSVRVTFDVPGGWRENVVPDVIWSGSSDARIAFGFVDNIYLDPCSNTAERQPPIGPTVDDLATALATLPGIDATGPSDVTLGGYSGKLVMFDQPAAGSPCGEGGIFLWEIPETAESAPLETGALSRIWILDVDGTRFVVTAVERESILPAVRAQVQAILDSLEIEP